MSHSSRDTWVARKIADAIGECGATPFLDEADIDAGEEFEDRIRDFLNQAHEVVVLLTPWALVARDKKQLQGSPEEAAAALASLTE